MNRSLQHLLTPLTVLILCFPFIVQADTLVPHQEYQETVPAKVISILSDTEREIPGLDISVRVQEVEVELQGGASDGQRVIFENELSPVHAQDRIFVDRLVTMQGQEYFIIKDVNRQSQLIFLTSIFVVCVLLFAGLQGLRALGSLALSIGAIFFLLIPALLAGYDPALSSFVISGVILAIVLFGTHGFNPISTISFFGTFFAVGITCAIAYYFVGAMRFTGVSSGEAVFLNFSTGGTLDFTGLLLGSIIIGALGVLDDISITQASVVQELKAAQHTFGALELYRRAIKVGRNHVGSLVNTLALAYVGASLPLILLLARAETDIGLTLNQEMVAVEITRIVVGSIGIILAVPVTTAIGAWYFQNRIPDDDSLENGHVCGHTHSH